MADLKITQLTPLGGTPAPDDLLEVVDVSDPTMSPSGTNKSVRYDELGIGAGGGSIGGTISQNQIAVGSATADEIEGSIDFTYDGSELVLGGKTTQNLLVPPGTDPDIWLVNDSTNAEILKVRSGVADARQIIFDVVSCQIEMYGGLGARRTEVDNGTILFANVNNDVKFNVRSSGVAIGDNVFGVTPTERLEVYGNIDITGDYLVNGVPISTGGIPDAPNDGSFYARRNLAWESFTPGGGGSAITFEDDGTPLTVALSLLNFVGAGFTITEPVADEITVTLNAPASDPTGITGASAVTNVVTISQADYDNIGTPDASTIYFITA